MSRPSAGLALADRRRLRWLIARDDDRAGRSPAARRNGGRAVIELGRDAPVLARPATAGDTRPTAPGRDPCPHCGARGDLGCDHYAPCAPVDLPRDGRGLLNEKGFLRRGASHNG